MTLPDVSYHDAPGFPRSVVWENTIKYGFIGTLQKLKYEYRRALRADCFLANGSMSSNQSGEGDIRRALIKADLVDCMVALPGQLFMATEKLNAAHAA